MAYIRKTPKDKNAWFIEKANKKHSHKFDYSNTAYTGSHNQVLITCRTHGDFSTTATSHLAGTGCPTCGYRSNGDSKKLTLQKFVEKANNVHSNFYDYSSSEYTRSQEDITIICPKHGAFKQKANSHLAGHGCPLCAREASSKNMSADIEHFMLRAKEAHGDKYDYSETVFKGYNNKVTIICPIHGQFEQLPKHHADGFGCVKCGSDILAQLYRRTREEFVEQARQAHGDKYDYSLVEYKNSNSKVLIVCSQHGVFQQSAQSHLSGRGCRECTLQGGYSQLAKGTLYVLKCGDITKVGITNKDPLKRAKAVSKSFGAEFVIYKTYEFDEGFIPLNLETSLLKVLRKEFKSPVSKFDGSTECFFNVDTTYLVGLIEKEINNMRIP